MMPDREKVKAELDEIVEQCRGMDYIGFSTITEHCQNILALLKDQEVVVRCKDCNHGKSRKNANGEDMVDCLLADNWLKHPDWFCADGERRTDDA